MATIAQTTSPPDDQLLTIDDIATLVGLASTATKGLVRRPGFPRAIRINRRVVRWWRSELLGWLDAQRSAASGPAPAPRNGVHTGRGRRHR